MRELFYLLVILSALISTSCETPKTHREGLPFPIFRYTQPPKDFCPTIVDDPFVPQQDQAKSCVSYNEGFYQNLDSRDFSRMQSNIPSDQKKKNFINMIAPAAIKVMQETKIPASVIIAQALLETGWGSSKVFARANNLFGHSCFSYGSNKKKVLFKGTDKERTITYDCTVKRPANEGHYYMKFESVYDSVSAYADNLLTNQKTSRAYNKTRNVVAKAELQGRVATWQEFVPTLGSYAADRGYRKKLGQIIQKQGLDRFDNSSVCGSIVEKDFSNISQCEDTIKSESVRNTERSFEHAEGKNGTTVASNTSQDNADKACEDCSSNSSSSQGEER